MFYEQIREELLKNSCDVSLYNKIVEFKKTNIYSKKNWEAIKVEYSIKKYDDNKIINGRYTITLSLEEFLTYGKNKRKEIFDMLHFDNNKFEKKITSIKDYKNYSLYLGFEGSKGKIYFLTPDNIICFESNNKIKFYDILSKNSNEVYKYKYICVSLDDIYKKYSVHTILNDPKDNIDKWFSVGKDYLTVYERPTVILKNNFTTDENLHCRFLKFWKYHNCSCYDCFSADKLNPTKKLSEEEFIKIIQTEKDKIDEKIDVKSIIDKILKTYDNKIIYEM